MVVGLIVITYARKRKRNLVELTAATAPWSFAEEKMSWLGGELELSAGVISHDMSAIHGVEVEVFVSDLKLSV